jgi:hypothetical protein
MGRPNFDTFIEPQGQVFILIFVYIFRIMLLSLLVAMFINKYQRVWVNIDAQRRMNIIRLKNTRNYDILYSGISITFFPISVIILPFVLFVMILKSERFNDFILKLQYAFMILIYCAISIVLSVFLIPCLYIKCIVNSFFIYLYNKRQAYKGESTI